MTARGAARLVGVLVAGWAVMGLALDGRIDRAPPLRPVSALVPSPVGGAGACPLWTLLAGVGQVSGRSAALFTDGLLHLRPCPDEAVAIDLTGSTADGVGPWVVLESADAVVFAGHVAPEGVSVVATAPVWLAFTNDLVANGQDRNLRASVR